MLNVTFSELRNQSKRYFDAVEKGEMVDIYRHGKLIAHLIPAQKNTSRSKRWQKAMPLRLKGISLSKMILDERERK